MFDTDNQLRYEIKSTGKKLIKELRKPCGIPMKWQIAFQLMISLPSLYRSYRIFDDPTLLDWEKKKKNGEMPYGAIYR